jgi:uncharacterized membrane protein HdeD (DUF308 family)/alpha-beta hydrolase superfamily lysophospholipase
MKPAGASWWRRLPWWLAALLGLACVVVGVVLVFRPFASLSVLVILVAAALITTGVAHLASARRAKGGWLTWAAGVAWITAGIVVLAWPDVTVRGVALVVGIAMIVGGVVDVVSSLRGSTDERIAAVIGGVASVIFGVLALSWPDVTLLVIAVVFGARTVLFGLRLLFSAFRGREGGDDAVPADRPLSRLRRFGHVAVAVIALVVAVGLAGVSARFNEGEPIVDSFYDMPGDVPAEPGALLRAESFTRDIPEGARAWRILYTTTRDEGVPAVASALVVTPVEPSGEPRPVIAWAHGTTGIARTCAPTVLEPGIGAGAFYNLDQILANGWVLVATDYVGLGTEGPHAYLIGQGEARSVLDAVRAARELEEAQLSEQTVVWGHSQGGHAALWTGVVAPSYAPDVPLAGIAAFAPASDLVGLVDNLGNVPGGSIFATYVLSAYADVYPDVRLDDYVRPAARETFAGTAERCLGEPSVLVSLLTSIATSMSIFSTDLASGPALERLEQNIPTDPIDAPLLIGQGAADSLVLADVQAAYVAARCADGQAVDYRTYEGRDHVPLVEPDSPLIPELVEWTWDRLAGAPAQSTCPTG